MLFRKTLKKTNSNDELLAIENLNYYFGKQELKHQILFDVNLEIDVGEIVILTGPSGSGKSTLLTLCGALRSIQSGDVRVLGHSLANATYKDLVLIRRNIGFIFQEHNLLEFLTARENVQMSAELNQRNSRKQARLLSESMLQFVKLGDRMDHYPANLSGGQKQRVAIARALVSQPQLVLADEPTASLDSKTGRDVVDLLKRLAREKGCSVLMVTHDNRILDVADRIVRMEDGHLVETVIQQSQS